MRHTGQAGFFWPCCDHCLNVSTDLSISSLPSHLSPRTRLNLRYNYRHPLRLQGLKREKKKPGKDAVGLISSIGVASMSYDWPRRAAAKSIAIPYSRNAVMRCIGQAFIHSAVYLCHFSLNPKLLVGANCLSEFARSVPGSAISLLALRRCQDRIRKEEKLKRGPKASPHVT